MAILNPNDEDLVPRTGPVEDAGITVEPASENNPEDFNLTGPTSVEVPANHDGPGVTVPGYLNDQSGQESVGSQLPPLAPFTGGSGVGVPSGPQPNHQEAPLPEPLVADQAEAAQREVTANELVENRLNALLSGDSEFIQNARRRGAELANRRGQFNSSLMAGTAQRAAIESALPIATADAQAYRDAATQNLAALTQTRLANLDASTRISMANLDALTRTNIANLDSATRIEVQRMTGETAKLLQQMQSQLQLEMQSRSINHERELEQFRQAGRMELAQLDADLRMALAEAGFQQEIYMSELDAAEALELNTILAEYELEKQNRDQAFNRRQAHINMAMQAQINYTNYLASFANTEMDAAAAARLQAQADAQLAATFEMINSLFPDQPPIDVQFGGG